MRYHVPLAAGRFQCSLCEQPHLWAQTIAAHAARDHEQSLRPSLGLQLKKRIKVCIGLRSSVTANFSPKNKLSHLLNQADELTAILASGCKSSVHTSKPKL